MLTSDDDLPSTVNAVLTGIGLTAVMLIIAFLCGLLIGKLIYQPPKDTICIPESRLNEKISMAGEKRAYLKTFRYCENVCGTRQCREECDQAHNLDDGIVVSEGFKECVKHLEE